MLYMIVESFKTFEDLRMIMNFIENCVLNLVILYYANYRNFLNSLYNDFFL